jgi:hypothetical protein
VGSCIEASRRRFLQVSAATSAAAVGGLVSSAACADDDLVMAGRSDRPSWAPTKYLIDCHCHLGSGPTVAELAPTIHSAADWRALCTAQPEEFAQAVSEDAVDDSAILLGAMDKYGVTHAIAASAIVVGVAVALAVRPPISIAAVVVAFFAVFHGHAHCEEMPSARSVMPPAS